MVKFLGNRIVLDVLLVTIGASTLPALSSLERLAKSIILTVVFESCRRLYRQRTSRLFLKVSIIVVCMVAGIKLYDQITTICHLTSIFTTAVNDRCVVGTLAARKINFRDFAIPGRDIISSVLMEFQTKVRNEQGLANDSISFVEKWDHVTKDRIWDFRTWGRFCSGLGWWKASLVQSAMSLTKNSVYATAQFFSSSNTCSSAVVNFRINLAKKASICLVKEIDDMKKSWWDYCVFTISLLTMACATDWVALRRNTHRRNALEDGK
jgi:hypothetical protein